MVLLMFTRALLMAAVKLFNDVVMEMTVHSPRLQRASLLPWQSVPVVSSTHETMLIYITTLLMFNDNLLTGR